MLLLRLVQELAHFEDRNHRQEADEQEQQEQEEADRADVGRPVPERRVVHAPRRRQEVAVEARDDDHEPLEPHADVGHDGDAPQEHRREPNRTEPQELRSERVAQDERPERRRVGADHAVAGEVFFVGVRAVEAEEDFHHIAVGHHQARGEHDLRHVFQDGGR